MFRPLGSVRLRVILFVTMALSLLILPAVSSAAQPPQPTYGSADVDGDPAEWDLFSDFFANMYEAGKADKDILSKLYLRYDCATETGYALVLVEPGLEVEATKDDEDFVKIDDKKKVDAGFGDDDSAPDFQYITSDDTVIGWEASFLVAPSADPYSLNVHTTVKRDRTSAVLDRDIELLLVCDGLSNVGDLVWQDANRDASYDVGENGLDSVTVRLADDQGNLWETTTVANGWYLFLNRQPGSYYIDVDEATVPNALPVNTTGNVGPTALTLFANQDRLDMDFGYAALAAGTAGVGGKVFFDKNRDGTPDGAEEPGLCNIRIDLLDADDNAINSMLTDSFGNYRFVNLPVVGLETTYQVRLQLNDPDLEQLDFLTDGKPETNPDCAPSANQEPVTVQMRPQSVAEVSGLLGSSTVSVDLSPGEFAIVNFGLDGNPLAVALAAVASRATFSSVENLLIGIVFLLALAVTLTALAARRRLRIK